MFDQIYQNRLNRFRDNMREIDVEAIIVQKPENRVYLSGFDGSAGMLMITHTSALLLVDFRYAEQARSQTSGFKIIQFSSLKETLMELFKDYLDDKKVGFEQDYVTWEQYETWVSNLGDLVDFIPVPDITRKLRMVKESQELEMLKKAAALADAAFEEILPLLRPGVSEREVAVELEYAMRCRGAQGMSFDTLVASGSRSSLVHGMPTHKVIEAGDLVVVDFGAVYGGYCSDCTRTVCMGNPTSKQQAIYDLVQRAQDAALEFIRPGVTAAEVDAVAREVIKKEGYGENFRHSLGHGVGLLVHEDPSLSSIDQTVLESGMVVTLEPGIYLPQWGGVRIEEMVVLTDTGCEVLTHAVKGLKI